LLSKCITRYKEMPTERMVREHSDWTNDFEKNYQEILKHRESGEFVAADFALDVDHLKVRYNEQILLKLGKSVYKENWNGKGFDDLEEANKTLRKTISEIDGIKVSKVYREGSLAGSAPIARDRYFEIKSNPELARGVHVGFQEFDRITNGLRPAELILIGGESGAGKSALAMNMALNAWRGSNPYPEDLDWVDKREYATDGVDVMYFTLEMPFDPLERRIDANLAGVPLNGIRDGTLSEEEEKRFVAATTFREHYNKSFYIVDIPRGCTVAQIEAKYLELLYEFTPQLVVVDYISLMKIMDASGSESDWLNIGKLAELLHEFCRTYAIPCITPVQLNRPSKGQNGSGPPPPDQHRVGRSIMLPQNCNIMINIHSRADEHLKPDMNINIAKMRDGMAGSFILHKRLEYMRIYDAIPGWMPHTYEVNDGYNDEEGTD
jgi:replicative DNA helicase